MKKIYPILGVLVLALTIWGCSGNSNSFDANFIQNKNIDSLDLRPFGIAGIICLPKSEEATPTTKHQLGSFTWNISIGKKLKLHIEDWGGKNPLLKKEEKLNSKSIKVFKKNDTLLYYKETKDGKSIYHALALRQLNGINYLFSTPKEGTTKAKAKVLYQAIQHIQPVSMESKFSAFD